MEQPVHTAEDGASAGVPCTRGETRMELLAQPWLRQSCEN